MASTTRNLRLFVDDNLSSTGKSNLAKIDALGAVFNLDNTASAIVRSAADIHFRPQDASIGGSGVGGSLFFGSAAQPAAEVVFYATSVSLGAAGAFSDQAPLGDKSLLLSYDSSLSGSVDTAASRSLVFDLDGADRNIILGGNYSQTGGNLELVLTGPVSWTLPVADAIGVLTNDGAGVLSWIPAVGSGTVTSIGVSATSPLSSTGGPISTAGTIAIGFQNQLANKFLAGPTSGGATAPAFRDLAAVDIQSIVGYRGMSQAWTSGTTFTVTHNWGTRKVLVEILDGDDNYREVFADDEERPTDNTVVLVANAAPNNWLVLLKEVP